MEWQPIKTAPLDGTRVIVVYAVHKGPFIDIARWDNDKYASEPRPLWVGNMSNLWGKVAARQNPPTHWMPLPDEPVSA